MLMLMNGSSLRSLTGKLLLQETPVLANEEAVLLRVARAQVRLQSRCLLDQASQYSAMQVRFAAHQSILRRNSALDSEATSPAFAGILFGSRHLLGSKPRRACLEHDVQD